MERLHAWELEVIIQDRDDTIQQLSNDLNAALKVLEVYRDFVSYPEVHEDCILTDTRNCTRFCNAERDYAKATTQRKETDSKGQDSTGIPPTNKGT